MANWHYINKDGEKITVTSKELKQLALQGTITPETIVETEEGKTAPARKVKGLTFAGTTQPESMPSAETYSLANDSLAEKNVQKSTVNYFYTDENGIKSGQINKQRLQTLIDRGTFTPSTILETDAGQQITVGEIPELNFNNVAPPPLAVPSADADTLDNFYCTNCGNTILEQAAVCMSCGAKPTGHKKFCRHCGVGLNPEQVVCIKCGCEINSDVTEQRAGGFFKFLTHSRAKNSPKQPQKKQTTIIRIVAGLLFLGFVFIIGIASLFQTTENIATTPEQALQNQNVPTDTLKTIKEAQQAFDQCMVQIAGQWIQLIRVAPNLPVDYFVSSSMQTARETGFYNGLDQYMESIRADIKQLDKNKYENTFKLYAILAQYEQAVNAPAGSARSYQDDIRKYRTEFTSVLSLAELEW